MRKYRVLLLEHTLSMSYKYKKLEQITSNTFKVNLQRQECDGQTNGIYMYILLLPTFIRGTKNVEI